MPVLGWRFKAKTPLWFMLIVGLLMLNSVLHFALLFTVSSWAQARPDFDHSYRVPFRDGVIYFVEPWLGAYLNAWWVGVALLVLLIVLLIQNRHQLERAE
jgi:uncharacterized integral membrane protein